jgi:hypothetical protein
MLYIQKDVRACFCPAAPGPMALRPAAPPAAPATGFAAAAPAAFVVALDEGALRSVRSSSSARSRHRTCSPEKELLFAWDLKAINHTLITALSLHE